MTREEALQKIIEIIRSLHTVDQEKIGVITEDTDFLTDISIPSIEFVNIMAKAEESFGVEFDDDDIDQIGGTKVSNIIDLILKYVNKTDTGHDAT